MTRKQNTLPKGECISAETRDRTEDPTIFSRVLYQLSYLGKPG